MRYVNFEMIHEHYRDQSSDDEDMIEEHNLDQEETKEQTKKNIGKAMDPGTGMFNVTQTIGTVLCCKCGVPMTPNAANMCVTCLRSEIDITEDLQKHVTIIHCPECNRYLQPPRTWIMAELESKDLLSFCVKRLKNLNKVRLVQAEFVWTEPHSKRVKVKLKVQKEVLNGAVLEQSFVVEYVVQDQMCDSCSRIQANPDQWGAAVQLRQHVSHRRTFFYLEQLILKHDAASRAIRIKQMEQGIDFFFGTRSHALKFVDFLGKVVPVRSRSDRQLVSQDSKNNTYNYKHTFSVEICPICREDLICLPRKMSHSMGNIGPLVICTKISNSIALLDPFTLRYCFLDADQYWRTSFKSLLGSRQLIKYLVFDVETPHSEVTIGGTKYALSYAQVTRESDMGKIFHITTHLGHILKPGDLALGYDLYGANSNDMELDNYGHNFSLPEVILIKKCYEEQRQRKSKKSRAWKLRSLDMEVDDSRNKSGEEERRNTEYEEFLRDLEENPELRFNISLYHNKEYQQSETASMTDGEGPPSIPLEELLGSLEIRDKVVVDEEDSSMED